VLKIHFVSFERGGKELRGPETVVENPLRVFSTNWERLRGPETLRRFRAAR